MISFTHARSAQNQISLRALRIENDALKAQIAILQSKSHPSQQQHSSHDDHHLSIPNSPTINTRLLQQVMYDLHKVHVNMLRPYPYHRVQLQHIFYKLELPFHIDCFYIVFIVIVHSLPLLCSTLHD